MPRFTKTRIAEDGLERWRDESRFSIKRGDADMILLYFAKEVAETLAE